MIHCEKNAGISLAILYFKLHMLCAAPLQKDIYVDIAKDVKTRFDSSNYASRSIYHNNDNGP